MHENLDFVYIIYTILAHLYIKCLKLWHNIPLLLKLGVYLNSWPTLFTLTKKYFSENLSLTQVTQSIRLDSKRLQTRHFLGMIRILKSNSRSILRLKPWLSQIMVSGWHSKRCMRISERLQSLEPKNFSKNFKKRKSEESIILLGNSELGFTQPLWWQSA